MIIIDLFSNRMVQYIHLSYAIAADRPYPAFRRAPALANALILVLRTYYMADMFSCVVKVFIKQIK